MAFNDPIKVLVAATVGTTAAAFGVAYLNQYLRNRIPKEWEAVGEVTDLFCFPVKGCAVVPLKEIHCGILGFENELFRDRAFMLMKPKGQLVSTRSFPQMLKIVPAIRGSILTLNAPDMPEITVDIQEALANPQGKFILWDSVIDYVDCGEEIAVWLSRYLLKTDTGIRLAYYPHFEPNREVEKLMRNLMWPDMTNEHCGTLQDESSYMMINEESVADLNSRLADKKVTPLWFRPNIVINGLPAFKEDDVKWFKIGNETIFKNLKPCLRCTFTTIDPKTAKKDEQMEPLKTLRTYRLLPGCELSPGMGSHLGVIKQDTIKIGDTVYVAKKSGWWFEK